VKIYFNIMLESKKQLATNLLSHCHDGNVFSEEDDSLHAVKERHPVQRAVGRLHKLAKTILDVCQHVRDSCVNEHVK